MLPPVRKRRLGVEATIVVVVVTLSPPSCADAVAQALPPLHLFGLDRRLCRPLHFVAFLSIVIVPSLARAIAMVGGLARWPRYVGLCPFAAPPARNRRQDWPLGSSATLARIFPFWLRQGRPPPPNVKWLRHIAPRLSIYASVVTMSMCMFIVAGSGLPTRSNARGGLSLHGAAL